MFVHGLRGHPKRTWEYSSGDGHEPVFWPQDFLTQDLGNQARVWTYGYKANVISMFEPNNRNTISQHGNDLIRRLERELFAKNKVGSLYPFLYQTSKIAEIC